MRRDGGILDRLQGWRRRTVSWTWLALAFLAFVVLGSLSIVDSRDQARDIRALAEQNSERLKLIAAARLEGRRVTCERDNETRSKVRGVLVAARELVEASDASDAARGAAVAFYNRQIAELPGLNCDLFAESGRLEQLPIPELAGVDQEEAP
jgi:hypothetical protein